MALLTRTPVSVMSAQVNARHSPGLIPEYASTDTMAASRVPSADLSASTWEGISVIGSLDALLFHGRLASLTGLDEIPPQACRQSTNRSRAASGCLKGGMT